VKYLVDANVLSELTKPSPDPRVIEWLQPSSVLEVGLVVVAAVMFLAMIVTALVVIIWSLAGVFSATRPPTAHH